MRKGKIITSSMFLDKPNRIGYSGETVTENMVSNFDYHVDKKELSEVPEVPEAPKVHMTIESLMEMKSDELREQITEKGGSFKANDSKSELAAILLDITK